MTLTKAEWIKKLRIEVSPNTFLLPNQQIKCRLRIKGTWGFLCGVQQHCLMLNKHMNVMFLQGNDILDFFDCNECPNPKKRDEILEFYKDQPNCLFCKENLATKKKKIKQFIQGRPITEYTEKEFNLCLSCFNG